MSHMPVFSGSAGKAALPVENLHAVCRDAWRQGLLAGCNGNASLRLNAPWQGCCCITRSGAAKGRLTAEDCCVVEIAGGALRQGGPASSETGMHLALYAARPDCGAILHTHPPHLLALSLRLPSPDNFLRIPLFEAEILRKRLGRAPALPPGSAELAHAVAHAGQEHDAVWMEGHGLCALGATLADALSLTEAMEHVAAVQLLALA